MAFHGYGSFEIGVVLLHGAMNVGTLPRRQIDEFSAKILPIC
jgi:hypothetical protein